MQTTVATAQQMGTEAVTGGIKASVLTPFPCNLGKGVNGTIEKLASYIAHCLRYQPNSSQIGPKNWSCAALGYIGTSS